MIENLLAVSPWRTQASFYRTAAGAEVDLILERPSGNRWAIEVKRGLTAKPTKGFYQALEDLQPERAFVVHAGEERYPLAKTVEALGLRDLMGALVAA